MLRLERDDLLHSPIVSSRRDAAIDVDDFNVSRSNEHGEIEIFLGRGY